MLAPGSWRPLPVGVCVARLLALRLSLSMFISRVSSKENIADNPSREDYGTLKKMGATWMEPVLDPKFEQADAWTALASHGEAASVAVE